MMFPEKIDLHMHTTVSDGTDSPEAIIGKAKAAGIGLFSVTDHDSVKSSRIIPAMMREGDPLFLAGVEFSCRDSEGQYHILGYGYDPEVPGVQEVVETGHLHRMKKLRRRLEYLEQEFGICFPDEAVQRLYAMDNPGKPHLGNLMAEYGYAESMEQAIRDYLNRAHFGSEYIRPEDAIAGILSSGGIPVLAHPCFGSGDQRITGDDMDRRLRRLIAYGLQGVEAFYSGFTAQLSGEMLVFAEKYGLYVTAGSDYHGTNKTVRLGDTGPAPAAGIPDGMRRFLEDTREKQRGCSV